MINQIKIKLSVFNVYSFSINTKCEKLKLLYCVDFFFNLFYTIFFVFCFQYVHLYRYFLKGFKKIQ